ncbi:fused MFS/spermidine synthase [Phycicoccus sp. CSK15P-2]|uniref:fused MFS/spermidine synthase n=1 Tax=Phycicoccus sp. CSK15P-2 TaxID=2807627 RepID=UPI00194DDEF8|nr:fused MFS/spermidine synthase [Phycicoccus sp. CSK15P-2]MBM6405360.1 fused MFS/spermidine synthase [Phycicoccus sp. CSK15P-2]
MTPGPARAGRATPTPAAGIGDAPASVLVFGSSCAVLVVEIVALRLLAPYFGLTLETSTLVIGLALAAIAVGAWLGGRWADGHDARGQLGRLLYVSGAVVAATPFLVRAAGEVPGSGLLLPVTTACIVVPGALLSAVTPMVTKLRLATLEETGSVVGRLSGTGTAGAITGTVVTGFVLISTVPVTWIMVGLGVLLAVGGVVTEVAARRTAAAATAVAVLVVGAGGALFLPDGCDVETTYHCAVVRADPERDGGRSLVLDNLRHSYVDLDDPEYLEFSYVKALAAATETTFPGDEPLTAHHLGGGGLTLPRWLASTRPGTTSTVSEIDPGVLEVDVRRLGLETGPDLEVRVEDARVGLDAVDDSSRDLVVGDAFGGVSVPWHLTTVEVLGEVRRVLRDDGLYAANLIDYPPLGFARAEVETLRAVFGHVALAATPATTEGDAGGNLVVLASDTPVDTAAWQEALDARDVGWRVIEGAELEAWVGDSPVLTDDYAPVDQLLTPYPS